MRVEPQWGSKVAKSGRVPGPFCLNGVWSGRQANQTQSFSDTIDFPKLRMSS